MIPATVLLVFPFLSTGCNNNAVELSFWHIIFFSLLLLSFCPSFGHFMFLCCFFIFLHFYCFFVLLPFFLCHNPFLSFQCFCVFVCTLLGISFPPLFILFYFCSLLPSFFLPHIEESIADVSGLTLLGTKHLCVTTVLFHNQQLGCSLNFCFFWKANEMDIRKKNCRAHLHKRREI